MIIIRYLSCPEKDDIDSDSTYEENNLFKIESNKTYEKNSLKSKEGVLTYEYLGERFCAEQEIDDNLITKAKSDSLNENKNKEAPLAITRKKSRVLPEEIKLNPRYLKGYAMDFESIYDLYERDLESLDRLDNRTAKANDSYVNFVNIGSQENKPFMTRKSLNPFSPTKKNFNMSETLKNPIISESVDNDYDDLKNNNNFDFKKDENDFKIKERTKSILKMLEFTLVRKRSLEQE